MTSFVSKLVESIKEAQRHNSDTSKYVNAIALVPEPFLTSPVFYELPVSFIEECVSKSDHMFSPDVSKYAIISCANQHSCNPEKLLNFEGDLNGTDLARLIGSAPHAVITEEKLENKLPNLPNNHAAMLEEIVYMRKIRKEKLGKKYEELVQLYEDSKSMYDTFSKQQEEMSKTFKENFEKQQDEVKQEFNAKMQEIIDEGDSLQNEINDLLDKLRQNPERKKDCEELNDIREKFKKDIDELEDKLYNTILSNKAEIELRLKFKKELASNPQLAQKEKPVPPKKEKIVAPAPEKNAKKNKASKKDKEEDVIDGMSFDKNKQDIVKIEIPVNVKIVNPDYMMRIPEPPKKIKTIFDVIYTRDPEQLSKFVESKPKTVDEFGPNRTLPINVATKYNLEEMVVILLKNKADPNKIDGQGRTALHYAAINNNVNIVSLLREHGASPDVRDGKGNYPKAYIYQRDQAVIDARNYIGQDGFHKLGFILKEWPGLEGYRFQHGLTLLHFAASENSVKCCEILLKYGADINAVDDKGRTPLCIAGEYNRKNSFRFLIESGADYNIADNKGKLPLDLINRDIVEKSPQK